MFGDIPISFPVIFSDRGIEGIEGHIIHCGSRQRQAIATFGRHQRLLKPVDFKAVFSDPRFRVSNRYLLILARPRSDAGTDDAGKSDFERANARLGLVIAKKNVRLAVERNRIKRLIRESFRQQQHLLVGIDIIVLARRGLDQQSNQAIFHAINEQWLIISKKASRIDAT